MNKPFRLLAVFFLAVMASGCASTLRTAPNYSEHIKSVKTVAVLPPDVKVYKITAGGVRELMDEWSDEAKQATTEALQKHLGSLYAYQIKIISEKELKASHHELWESNQGLYSAVAREALLHAYIGPEQFPYKAKVFDYTLGPDVSELAKAYGADLLVFVYGYDHDSTVGRTVLKAWNLIVSTAISNSPVIMADPSAMMLGVVNGTTGDLEWFKVTPGDLQCSFRDPKKVDSIVEWLLRDMVKKDK